MDLVSIGEFARLSRLSPKALRLYDQLGLLPPERVDPGSGYRWYAPGQLHQARLVAALRQIEMPLQEIKTILDLDPDAAAEQLAGYWVGVETEHAARRALAGSLVGYLDGKRSVMYDVATRNVPARSLLCLQRHVNSGQIRAVGRDFIARFRDGSVPRLEGVPGALFVIYYVQVSDDSDGPIEWCRPVPDADAAAGAARFPSPCAPSPPMRRRSSTCQRGGGRRDREHGRRPGSRRLGRRAAASAQRSAAAGLHLPPARILWPRAVV